IPDQIKMRNGKGLIRHRVCLAKVTVAGTEDGAVD
ncbi:hypothetical protein Tco_0889279, partial [Tanacetum coccineum]